MKRFVPYVCAAVLMAACSPGEAPEAAGDAGFSGEEFAASQGENTYYSAAFGVTVTAPEGWYVGDSEFSQGVSDLGEDMIAEGMSGLEKRAFEASVDRSANIFTFMKHEPGAFVETNPSVMAVAENVSLQPGIKNGRDYFRHMLRLLDQSGLEYEQIGDYSVRMIDGHEFDQLDIQLDVGVAVAKQTYLGARHGDNVVAFIQTHDEASNVEVEAVIDSIRLDW